MPRTAAIALCIAAVAGCGGAHHKASHASHTGTQSALAQAEATHEYLSRPPPPQRAKNPASSAAKAVRAFATAYINWTAQTVAADMRTLAAHSIGQAHSAMALAAAETADDYELRRGGIANHGTVEAIAPRRGQSDEYVVVTVESTSATNTAAYEGLRPAWHVALATVTEQQPGEWVLSGWQPEN